LRSGTTSAIAFKSPGKYADAWLARSPDRPVIVDGRIEGWFFILSVRNEGHLIAPDNLEKVFQPYWRPASSVCGGGLGLGLFICKQIAKAHGGEFDVRSSLTEGTCFAARLPIAPDLAGSV
jgi:signal transduction histidine kinase